MNLEKLFHLKERGTNVQTEIFAGITTFMTMAYILAINPSVLSNAGMDKGAVFTATAITCCLAGCLMALLANHPVSLAPSLALNTYFVYSIVVGMGYSWQTALTAVFLEGILLMLLSATKLCEGISSAIPMNLKHAISAGTGLYVTFIGLQNAKIVVNSDSTLVQMFSFSEALQHGTFFTEGITVILGCIGILITAILLAKQVKGNILWGILITWGLGVICQLTGLYKPDIEAGFASVLPDFSNGFGIPSLAPAFAKLDFDLGQLLSIEFATVILAILFVDLFANLAALIVVGVKAEILDENGNVPKVKKALLSGAIATTAGSFLGTSTMIAYVDSVVGVAEGGRTGLMALTTAFLFGLSLIFSPIFLAIPFFATAPALVAIGFFMFSSIREIDFGDITEGLPAFFCLVVMPFTYSIPDGIAAGVISSVVLYLVFGRRTGKKMSPIMFGLAGLFLMKYIFV